MGVAYDNVAGVTANGVSSIETPPFTIGSGANRAALIGFVVFNAVTGVTISVGGASGTAITSATATDGLVTITCYGALAPNSGSQTATASWTTDALVGLSVETFSDVDQTGVNSGSFTNGIGSFGVSPESIAITSASGDLTASALADEAGAGNATSNQTRKITGELVSMDIGPGTGTTTHTWTKASTNLYLAGANVVAAGGGAPPARRRLLLGVGI